MNIIEIQDLSHRFPDGSCGIKNIDLNIKKGSFVVIAGQNGSGKTTLIRHINGLLEPDHGRIKVDGINVQKAVKEVRQIVGMVFQEPDNQIIGETVFDDIAFGPENLHLTVKEVKKRVLNALSSVGLMKFSQQRPHTLSGGEKRRLAIAGVLAMDPKILIFDEPFSNLDYPGVRQFLRQVILLHKQGHTILLTTHELDKVIAHADRLLVMKNGRIVLDGFPKEILKNIEQYGIREPLASRLGMEVKPWVK